MYGRWILSYSLEAFDTEFYIIDHVYGRYECSECHTCRIDIEFYGIRAAIGNYFMGKHDGFIRKSNVITGVVDIDHTGSVFDRDTVMYDQYRKLYKRKSKSKSK